MCLLSKPIGEKYMEQFMSIIERLRNMAYSERDIEKAHAIKRIADDLYGIVVKNMDDGK